MMTLRFLLLLPICMLGCNSEEPQPSNSFSTDVRGLHLAIPTSDITVKDGDTVRLTMGYVKKQVSGKTIRMMAYNGSTPGPTLRIPQQAAITILLINKTDVPTTLHSHGVRVDYRDDGVEDTIQDAIAPGDSFAYSLRFPDAGVFWYHSHVREDYSLEMGAYGNYLVVPKDSAYWEPVNREVNWIVDDMLMDGGGMAPFSIHDVDHTLMGRFGNTFLVNGDTGYTITVRRKEIVRFFVTNAANTRVFNLYFGLQGMKIVGSDNGKYEKPIFSGTELIAPGERSVLEVHFLDTGIVNVSHLTPNNMFTLAHVHVLPESVTTSYETTFFALDSNEDVGQSIDPYRAYFDKEPDKQLIFTGTMDMHGMAMKVAAPQHYPGGDDPLGIEWVDPMPDMNDMSNTENMRWVIRDRQTGLENNNIKWHFKQGDKVMIRIYNDSLAYHAMPHPIHFHGQRFLVVNVNGIRNRNMAWKDTFLVGRAATVDLLLDAGNPGDWIAHCHIAEHMEDMMMLNFSVEPGSN